MGEDLLRIIPTDPGWVPDEGASRAGLAALRAVAPQAELVSADVQPVVGFVDAGENQEGIHCPSCGRELATDWWRDRMDAAYSSAFTDLAVETPCCAAGVTLDGLDYRWPQGFARFVLTAREPQRGWLDDGELGLVSRALGHPVRQIRTHY